MIRVNTCPLHCLCGQLSSSAASRVLAKSSCFPLGLGLEGDSGLETLRATSAPGTLVPSDLRPCLCWTAHSSVPGGSASVCPGTPPHALTACQASGTMIPFLKLSTASHLTLGQSPPMACKVLQDLPFPQGHHITSVTHPPLLSPLSSVLQPPWPLTSAWTLRDALT